MVSALSDLFKTLTGLRRRNTLSPLLLNCALEFSVRIVERRNESLILSSKLQILALQMTALAAIQYNMRSLIQVCKKIGLDVNTDKLKDMVIYRRKISMKRWIIIYSKGWMSLNI